VQRINLTTALGTSLVNTLFVLDEPSIGLHPRDMQARHRRSLKAAAGRPAIRCWWSSTIRRSCWRLTASSDLGPGAGEGGGEIVFYGTPGGRSV